MRHVSWLVRASAPFALVFAVAGCGGGEEPAPVEPEPTAETSGDEEEALPNDGVAIEGVLGTMRPESVQAGIDSKMNEFFQCFVDRYHAIAMLGGHVELYFHVALDGTVMWVYTKRSSVGDRDTERCIEEVASRIRFARPHGGEAEFTESFELDPPEDVRPPVAWDSARVAHLLAEHGETIRTECGATAPIDVTAYVGRGGRVLAAGAAIDQPDTGVLRDCVVQHVQAWELPNPGSYPAKVTFAL